MTPIQIESQNSVLKIVFSHRTGKIGDVCLYTGQLEGQNVLKFIAQHPALSGTPVLFQKNWIFTPNVDSISNRVLPKLQYEFKKLMSISQYFRKYLFNLHFPMCEEAFGPKNPK